MDPESKRCRGGAAAKGAVNVNSDAPPGEGTDSSAQPVRGIGEHLCDVQGCSRTFGSKRGLSIHQRSAHPAEYHAQVVAGVNAQHKKRWTAEETLLFARACVDGVSLADLQVMFPHRTLESLKCRKRQAAHKRAVDQVLAEVVSSPSRNEESPPLENDGKPDTPSGDRGTRVDREPDWASALRNDLMTIEREKGDWKWTDLMDLDVDGLQKAFNSWHDGWVKKGKEGGRQGDPGIPDFKSRSQRKRWWRGFTLKKYNQKPDETVRQILDDRLGKRAPEVPGQYEYWREIFSRESVADKRDKPSLNPVFWEVMEPISRVHLRHALTRLRNKAPGPDGIQKSDLLKMPRDELRGWFNLFLLRGFVPTVLKKARTTLIPKVERPSGPHEFRPITIASIILRLFHNVLARRLEKVQLHSSQKGFRRFDGLSQNVWLLRALLRSRTETLKPIHMCFLDIRKAFDSVSHDSLLVACKRVGLPDPFLRYLRVAYSGCTTVLSSDSQCREIGMTVGVKQGCPLSTYLFNYVIEMVASSMSADVGVECRDGSRVNRTMFADDTCLMAESAVGLQKITNDFVSALARTGMTINPKKCQSLSIVVDGKRKKWAVDATPYLSIGGELIPASTISSTYRYLGVQLGASHISHEHVLPALREKISRLISSALLPQHKCHALRTIVIPGLYHELSLGDWGPRFLTNVDRVIRKAIRRILHLPKDTPVSFFHSRHCSGGLSIPEIRSNVLLLRQKRLEACTDTDDPLLRMLVKSKYVLSQIEKAAEPIKVGGWSVSDKATMNAALASHLHRSVDGRGLSQTEQNEKGHKWVIDRESKLAGREYVSAVQVRGNLCKTRARSGRGRATSVFCTACPDRPETLGHILQVCRKTYGMRIERHNAVCRTLKSALEARGWEVMSEPRIPSGNSFLKPDLVCHRGDQVLVLDPIISADNANLKDVRESKIRKYSDPAISAYVAERYGGSCNLLIEGVVLSWRGVWEQKSWQQLQQLGLPATLLELISVRVLNFGKWMFNAGRQRTDA